MKYTIVKNLMDRFMALLLLTLLSPILILCILLIIIEDFSSSPLFIQKRIGLRNKEFKIYKLRTMRNQTVKNGKKLTDRQRMLKTGIILRKTSLDELPQLINIIKGEMSFIGPRPLSIKYLPYYNETEIKRHNVKPGISGWAQVNGRNTITWEEKFKYDVEYVKNVSFFMDLKIFVLTVYKVFRASGVKTRGEGVEEDFHEYRKKQIAERKK